MAFELTWNRMDRMDRELAGIDIISHAQRDDSELLRVLCLKHDFLVEKIFVEWRKAEARERAAIELAGSIQGARTREVAALEREIERTSGRSG